MNKNKIELTVAEIRDFRNGDFLKLLRRKGAPVIQDGKDLMIDENYEWTTYFDDKTLLYTVKWSNKNNGN